MCYMDRFTGLESPEIIQRLIRTIKLFKPINTLIENNNQGLPIYQSMARIQGGITPFNTNAHTKPLLINDLISAFSSRAIKVLDDNQVRLELQGYIFRQSATGKIQFTSSSGSHDDICMSLAIAWKCYLQYNNPNRYTIRTNQDSDAGGFDNWIRDIDRFRDSNPDVMGSGGGGFKFPGGNQ